MDSREMRQPQIEDTVGVGSRVSWAAVFAGAVMTLAAYLLLTLLGAAVGLSLSDTGIRANSLGVGAVIWAIVTVIASLFLGGYVSTLIAVGENRCEAMVHGVLVWGVVTAMMFYMMAAGVRVGYSAALGAAYVGGSVDADAANGNWEAVARRAGMSDERIAEIRGQLEKARQQAGQAADSPETRQQALNATTSAVWVTLVGTLLSMAAAVVGGVMGSGPTARLLVFGAPLRRTGAGSQQQQQELVPH